MLSFLKNLFTLGGLFSRWKKKTAVEQLEYVEEEIKELEVCRVDTEKRHRQITHQLLMYSSGFAIVSSILLYFYFPAQVVQTKIVLIVIFLLFPILYYLITKLISWYYNRKIRESQTRLKDLKKEKQRLLDEIMNKETYKVAKDILEKYAPESLPPKFGSGKLNLGVQLSPNASLARRQTSLMATSVGESYLVPRPGSGNLNMAFSNQCKGPVQLSSGDNLNKQPSSVDSVMPFMKPESYLQRMFEFLIGEGPNSKYALICSNCKTHNGMALVEEFEYTAFKCYSCKILNPARKERPLAPKLEEEKSDQEERNSDKESYTSESTDSEPGYRKEDNADEAARDGLTQEDEIEVTGEEGHSMKSWEKIDTESMKSDSKAEKNTPTAEKETSNSDAPV